MIKATTNEIMEHNTELESNLLLLTAEMVALEKIRAHVEQRRGESMKNWLHKVTRTSSDVDDIQNQFSDGSHLNDLIGIQNFNSKITETLDRVKVLIQEGKLNSNSVEILMRQLASTKPKRYSYKDIVSFTTNFTDKIGSGGFGDVYRGKFSNGAEVAVKVLKISAVAGTSFEAEVRTMGKTSHRNLVKLYGFCSEGDTKALVYEYLKNGSLDTILFDKSCDVEWSSFYRIAIDIAKALAYLHEDCKDQIIHHDLKPANVLLDKNLSPKVADFGLANLMDRSKTHLSVSGGRGSIGYIAPELHGRSHVTCKCDVYGYGMILFEFLSRQRNSEGTEWFPKTVWKKFENKKLDEIMAECDISERDRKKATILSMVAFWCAQYTPETRPSMTTVVMVLEREILVNTPPSPFLPSDPRKSTMQPKKNYSQVGSSTSAR